MQYADNRSDSLPDGRNDGEMLPPPKRRRVENDVDAAVCRELGVMREGLGNTSASFVGSASGIHFIRSVYNAMDQSTTEETSPAAADLVPGEDDRLTSEASHGARRSIWLDHEVAFTDSTSARPTFENFTEWTSSYFDAWHPIFPFLHAPTVLEIFEITAQNGTTGLDPFDCVMLKSVLSLGLADQRQSTGPPLRPIPTELVFLTFDEALQSVQAALARPATIKALQAVTCVQLFLISMLRLNAASRLGGLIIQMAFQLGLHRCSTRFKAFSLEEGQLRKRLFWSIYCLERYLCQALGLPLLIHDEDVDVCFLNKELHDSPKGHRNGASDQSSSAYDGRLQLLAFLAQHAQLRGAIMELRNKKVQERDRNPDAPTLINAKLMQWWNEVEDFIDQQPTHDTGLSSLHRAILKSLRHESVIMLNRPLLALQKDSANYSAAIHTCIGAAKSILTTLTTLLQPKDVINGQSLPMIWPSFTWAAWMSAFIMFYASAEGKVDAKVANRNIDKSTMILKSLGRRGSVWPLACAVAIDDLNSTLRRKRQKDHNAIDVIDQHTSNPADVRSVPSSRDGYSSRIISRSHNDSGQAASRSSFSGGIESTLDRSRLQQGFSNISDSQSEAASNHRPQAQSLQNIFDAFPDDSLAVPYDTTENFGEDLSWQNLSFLSKAMPQMSPAGGDPLLGFDIPFWMGQDNYVAWTNDTL